MEEKERLEKLEPAEALADRGEKTETIEAGSGRKDRREAGLNMDGELSVEAVRRWLLWAGLALGICLAAPSRYSLRTWPRSSASAFSSVCG